MGGSPRAATSSSYADIIAAFYPPELSTVGGLPVPPAERQAVAVSGSLDPSGPTMLVIAYGNGARGALRVVAPQAPPALVASVAPLAMCGTHIDMSLRDLDGDGKPEMIVTMRQARGLPVTWIYRWTGVGLRLIGPTDPDDANASDLGDVTLLDIDGDGTVDLIDHQGGRGVETEDGVTVTSQERVLTWSGGTLHVSPIDYFATFGRATAAPAMATVHFDIADAAAKRELRLVNGDGAKHSLCTSARISLNGKAVVDPSMLNKNTERLRVPATVTSGENALTAEVDGTPGCTLNVIVAPAP
jgi:hypothetical protein